MTYLIINTDEYVAIKEVINLINSYIGASFKEPEDILDKPDFHIVQPGEKGNITIEQSKELQRNIIYTPFENQYQFGIILNAESMTQEAQNSLLKTLEEKEENTILILTTNNEKSVLETILSRCTRIYPKQSKSNNIQKGYFEIEQFLEKQIYEKISQVEEIVKEDNVQNFLDELIRYFKEKYEEKIFNNESYTKELKNLEILREAKFRIEKNVNKKVALEHICFQIDKD